MKITICELPKGGFQVKIDGENVGVNFKVADLQRAFELIPTYVDVRGLFPSPIGQAV